MSPDRSWLTIVSVVLGTRWALAFSGFQRGKRLGDITHFPGRLGIRLLCAFVTPVALYGAGVVAFSSSAQRDWWVSFVLFALFGTGLLLWPEEIETSSAGVSQKRFFGFGRKQIPWSDLDYVADDPTRGIILVSKNGLKIVHSSLHIGHDDFLTIVKQHHRVWGSYSPTGF